MAVQVDILAFIIVVLLVLITVFLVPLLIQAKNTAQRIDEFLHEAQRDLLPMLSEMRQASERLNKASSKADGLVESMAEAGEAIHRVNEFLHHDMGRYMGNAAGLWLGIRAASKVLLKQVKQQQGGE